MIMTPVEMKVSPKTGETYVVVPRAGEYWVVLNGNPVATCRERKDIQKTIDDYEQIGRAHV